jgi:peroxiredoxin Q/BCP
MPKDANHKLKIGDLAPDFTLADENGNDVTLSSFRGKNNVVLIFYPGDMTPGCTMQLCAIRDDWSKFQAVDTVVFGINHGDAESHKRFIAAHGFPFPLLIDKFKKISAQYGATGTIFKHPIIKRSVVVVDKHGRIAFLRTGMPKDSEIIKAIKN